MVGVPEDVRDLGPIEGREIGPDAAPAPPSPAPGAAPLDAPPPGPPVPSTDLVPVPPPSGSVVGSVRNEAVEAWHDIRDAHRRGPKPNSRPLPQWVRRLAWVLDDSIPIPATGGRRIGIDGILTLVPGIGDAAGIVLSMVVVTAGVAAGVSVPTILRMLLNVGFEGTVGLIPFGGALFDMAYKANEKNVRLIEADLADRSRTRRSSLAIIVALVLTLFVGMVMAVVLALLGVTLFVWFLFRVFG